MATALPHFLMGLPICVALSTEDFFLTTSPYCACTAFNSCHDTSTWCVTPGDIVLLCTQSHSRRMPEAKMSKVISTRIDDLRGIAAGFLFGQLLLVTVGKSSVCECRGGCSVGVQLATFLCIYFLSIVIVGVGGCNFGFLSLLRRLFFPSHVIE